MSVSKRLSELLPEEKRALLAQLLQKKAREPRSSPLSFAQQRLWFLEQLAPGTPLYNIPAAIRITGPLDVVVAERSLNEIVRRHEVLRTTIATVDGQPAQIISPALSLKLPVVDLREFPETEQEAEIRRLASEEAQRPFDLGQGPLLRVALLRLAAEDHVLLVTMHHIISDGWSIGVFVREAVALYGSLDTGTPSPLPELPIQYADYAVWQGQWLQGEVLERQLAYWKRQLAGISALELHTDRPRPVVQTYRGRIQSFPIPTTLFEGLKILSRREGITLFMTLLAAFQTLLYRYTGQEDISVGTPIAGRNRLETEGLIGFFVNILVLRTDLSDDPSFRELLGRVRDVALAAYAHQDLPFEKLVEELQPPRDLGRPPLFQVMFNLLPAPTSPVQWPDLTFSLLEVDSGTAEFDLSMTILEGPEGLRGTLQYNIDLFDAASIDRMLGHFQVVLEGITSDPEQRLSTLPILTEEERQRLLVEWNDTRTEYPQGQCIHELLEAQVERTPEAKAVVFEEQHLTYRELNRRANQVAHRLQRLGVGPEVGVGICMERSLEMVVGLLGILKAGGAYVPLDPAYPKERLAFMLDNAGVPVLLTQERLVERLPEQRTQVVCLDQWMVNGSTGQRVNESIDSLTHLLIDSFDSEVTADNLAYVIYTSGSTGRPKGVLVAHQNLVHSTSARTTYYRQPVRSFLLLSSFAFDS
jgi:hypothetical protein